MTPEQQSKANHLALVAATILNATLRAAEPGRYLIGELVAESVDIAEALQKAAEERVAHE